MKRVLIVLTLLLTPLTLFSCSRNKYTIISAQEAKMIMDTESDYIILDVRTVEEYNSGHIPNAILIPSEEIKQKAESILKNKDQLILVYCRSGRRSKQAATALASLGYANIKEFGGIIDWPYEISYE